MRYCIKVIVTVLVVLLTAAPLFAQKAEAETEPRQTEQELPESETQVQALGEELVQELWNNIAAGNTVEIVQCMGDGFQSVHPTCRLDAGGEAEFLGAMELGDYTIENINATLNGSTMMVTYEVRTHQRVVGETISSDPSPRLCAWNYCDGEWEWILHADLREL